MEKIEKENEKSEESEKIEKSSEKTEFGIMTWMEIRRIMKSFSWLGFVLGSVAVALVYFPNAMPSSTTTTTTTTTSEPASNETDFIKELQERFPERLMPLVFIGGMPRSGTTLSRVMLDAHPDIRCGEETHIVPQILRMRTSWTRCKNNHNRLIEAGIDDTVFDDAIASFILEIIVKHGDSAQRFCNKDPFTMSNAKYLHKLFPNAKFIFMIRDGRATVNSMITRKVGITGFNLKSPKQCLQKWNWAIKEMAGECVELGSNCLPVYYEHLVLNPRECMEGMLDFLNMDWDEVVLHHEEHINKPGGVSLSKSEPSTDQVVKPVHSNSLASWVGKFPEDVIKNMTMLAPMLDILGYNSTENPPDYGDPIDFVEKNTLKIKKNKEMYKKLAQEARNASKMEV